MRYRRHDAKQPLAFNGEEVYIRFVGYCNHVMRQFQCLSRVVRGIWCVVWSWPVVIDD
jgi:hypothetical protein